MVSCPSLRGCYSQGETVQEALVNIKEAIELVLEDMKALENRFRIPRRCWFGALSSPSESPAARHPGAPSCTSFERFSYEVICQRGSHLRLRHPQDPQRQPLSIPDHDALKPGLLRRLIRDAELDLKGFLELLNRWRRRGARSSSGSSWRRARRRPTRARTARGVVPGQRVAQPVRQRGRPQPHRHLRQHLLDVGGPDWAAIGSQPNG